MIILCCNITKFNTEIVLLLSVSPLNLFYFPSLTSFCWGTAKYFSPLLWATTICMYGLFPHCSYMLDISLVSEILCLMPEEELNKNLLLWASKSLTVISHWAPSSGLNNTKYDLIKFSLFSQCNSKNRPEFELGIPTPVLDLHNKQAYHFSLLVSTTQCTLYFETHIKEY